MRNANRVLQFDTSSNGIQPGRKLADGDGGPSNNSSQRGTIDTSPRIIGGNPASPNEFLSYAVSAVWWRQATESVVVQSFIRTSSLLRRIVQLHFSTGHLLVEMISVERKQKNF
jgi:hypothetical protein